MINAKKCAYEIWGDLKPGNTGCNKFKDGSSVNQSMTFAVPQCDARLQTSAISCNQTNTLNILNQQDNMLGHN